MENEDMKKSDSTYENEGPPKTTRREKVLIFIMILMFVLLIFIASLKEMGDFGLGVAYMLGIGGVPALVVLVIFLFFLWLWS